MSNEFSAPRCFSIPRFQSKLSNLPDDDSSELNFSKEIDFRKQLGLVEELTTNHVSKKKIYCEELYRSKRIDESMMNSVQNPSRIRDLSPHKLSQVRNKYLPRPIPTRLERLWRNKEVLIPILFTTAFLIRMIVFIASRS
jgi:hypothetical protein